MYCQSLHDTTHTTQAERNVQESSRRQIRQRVARRPAASLRVSAGLKRGDATIEPPWEIVTIDDYRRRHALYVEDDGLRKV